MARDGDLPDRDELFQALEEVGLQAYESRLAPLYEGDADNVPYETVQAIALDLREEWNSLMQQYEEEFGEEAHKMREYEQAREEHERGDDVEPEHPIMSDILGEVDDVMEAAIAVMEPAKEITGGTEENYQDLAEYVRELEIPDSESDPYEILEDVERNAERFAEVTEETDIETMSELAAVSSLFALITRIPLRA